MKARLEETLVLAGDYPRADIIALGGAVHNRQFEAVASYNWLLEQGIQEERIILDMTGLDVVTQTYAVIDALKQNNYKDLLIVSNYDDLPRHFLSLKAALHEDGYDKIGLQGMSHDNPGHDEITDIEWLKSWHTTLRSAGIFTEAFYK